MEEMVLDQGDVVEDKGVGERLMRELIKSPKFKASLKILTSEMDAAAARGTVRALMWEDVETFMGTVSVLPSVINYSVEALHELAIQLNAFPQPMLVAFLSQLAENVDFKAMEEAIVEFKILLEKLSPVFESLKNASAGVAAELARVE